MNKNGHQWGLAAAGRHGRIEIVLDEPVGHLGPWQLELSGGGWQLVLAVDSPGVVQGLSTFVKQHGGRKVFAEFPVGSFEEAVVALVKDSEFADRFWLRVRGGAGTMAEFTFDGEDAVALDRALEEVVLVLAH